MVPTPPLSLPGHTHIAATADELYDDLAHALIGAAFKAVKDRGVFHLALSGGKSPEPFFVRLVTDPRFRALPWQQTHVWMVDERRVPHTDDRSNWKMIHETLVDHVGMKRRQAHPMPVDGTDPAAAYEHELRQAFGLDAPASNAVATTMPATLGPVPRLDFVMLGMGDDGHTASLFPGSDALGETRRLLVTNDGPHVTPPPRITMTYPLLNAARELAAMVVGEKKAATLQRISRHFQSRGPDPANYPITGIHPPEGQFTWYLDAAAAGQNPDGDAPEN